MNMKNNLINKCKEAEPEQKNIITTAIRILKNHDEMKQFYQECANLISKISDKELKRITGLVNQACEFRDLPQLPKEINSKEIARHLISYVLSACNYQTIQNWKQVIPELTYPLSHAWRYLSDYVVLDDEYGFRKS